MRPRLAAPVLALLVAGVLLLGPAPVARACLPGPVPTKRLPVSRATVQDLQHVVASGPGYVDVVRRDPLPPGAVVFEGTAVALDVTQGPGDPAEGRLRAAWTFAVERVVHGWVGPQAVIVDHYAGSFCGAAHYVHGARQRVWARWDPATGELHPLYGVFDVPPAEPHLSVSAYRRWASGPHGVATAVTLTFLAVIGVLGVSLVAAGTYLRAKALALKEPGPERGATRLATGPPLRWPPDAP